MGYEDVRIVLVCIQIRIEKYLLGQEIRGGGGGGSDCSPCTTYVAKIPFYLLQN